MGKYILTQPDLLEHLKEQILLMENSISLYDKGCDEEAKRLAVNIRILVHDSKSSNALLTQLNKRDIHFLNTATPYDRNNLLSYHGLIGFRMNGREVSYVAKALMPSRESEESWITFSQWWQNTFVIKDSDGTTFSRRELVRYLADQAGGAHVDPNLDEIYAKVSRLNSLGWKRGANGVESNMPSPIPACVRQISYEILKTLEKEFPDCFSRPNAAGNK